MNNLMCYELVLGLVLISLFSSVSADVSCYICGGCNDAFEVSKAQTASGCKSCKKFKEWGDYSSTIIRTCDLSTIGDGCSDEIAGIDSQTCYCRTDFCNSAQNMYLSRVVGLVGLIITVFL
ncbi:uncharacterized protein LOC128206629 isoform X2 [Mya arenaria]|uniref:uncharacterized protein LOC128206629 isoform X1 n=1 Tax=Mya arenaria TaxID=6604 RepID=UPI0022E728D1|nr:uncharacterized protein LOC128206629 isoform X1 [Mya arenaria]XP_052765172.1 uncharacterized protein LOC128206629 isoform X2 [Mya arenaria]